MHKRIEAEYRPGYTSEPYVQLVEETTLIVTAKSSDNKGDR
jgi:hypothetical protein